MNMNKLMKFFTVALTLTLALPISFSGPAKSEAQGSDVFGLQIVPFEAEFLSEQQLAADTEPLIAIKYVGTAVVTTSVAVEADGNLTFVEGGAAHDGFECPVSAPLGGVIDVSDTACDTWGEVVDIINNDADGVFKAVLVG